MRVAVVGLGLIGGSLARDLAAKGHRVFAYDRSKPALKSARRAGVIRGELAADLEGVESCDVCVLALPVDAIRGVLKSAAPRLAHVPLVTDVGSTKLSIMGAAARAGIAANFVGSHPLAGDHESGWRASRRGLFRSHRVYITASKASSPASKRLALRLWSIVGARTVRVDAAEHDALLSATSHLPQVTALALAMLLADAGIARSTLGRGGRDMTRLAASNPEIWSAIIADNRANIVKRIARLRKALKQVEARVGAGDAEALRRLITLCGRWARR